MNHEVSPADAGVDTSEADVFDAGGFDVGPDPDFAPCVGHHYVLYVTSDAGFGSALPGPHEIDESKGVWSLTDDGYSVGLVASDQWSIYWTVDLSSPAPQLINKVGTFTVDGKPTSSFAVKVDGTGCPSLVAATIQIVDIYQPIPDFPVKRMMFKFTATCEDAGFSGCVAFGA